MSFAKTVKTFGYLVSDMVWTWRNRKLGIPPSPPSAGPCAECGRPLDETGDCSACFVGLGKPCVECGLPAEANRITEAEQLGNAVICNDCWVNWIMNDPPKPEKASLQAIQEKKVGQ